MLLSDYPFISKEVWLPLSLIALIALLLVSLSQFEYALPFFLLFVVIAYLFRDPVRQITSEPMAVVAPVDACLHSIETVDNPYINARSIRLQFKMHRRGVYRMRSPIEGKVENQWYLLPGDRLPDGKQSVSRFRASHWIKTDEGHNIVITMREYIPLLRPRCYIQAGERVGQGQRCGMMPFGTQISVYLPANSRIMKQVGECVQAGSDIIAYLSPAEETSTLTE